METAIFYIKKHMGLLWLGLRCVCHSISFLVENKGDIQTHNTRFNYEKKVVYLIRTKLKHKTLYSVFPAAFSMNMKVT